jgi:hypothetical protein
MAGGETAVRDSAISVTVWGGLPRWWLLLIVVRRFEYASDPESYTSGSVITGRASVAGQVKG